MKKIVSFLVALCMACITICPACLDEIYAKQRYSEYEEDDDYSDYEYNIYEDGVCILEYNGQESNLEVPETMDEYPVISIGKYAFSDCISLKSVKLPRNIQTIEQGAFMDCTNLQSIELPESLNVIEEYSFDGCESLKSVKLPESVQTIGYSAFENCKNLQSIELPESLNVIEEDVFDGCESLKSVKLPVGVQTIGNSAFKGCTNLQNIELPEGLERIGTAAFDGCKSLEEIVLPDGIKELNASAFAGCSGLQKIEAGEGSTLYSSLDGVLYNKDKTTIVRYPGGKSDEITFLPSVNSIGDHAFAGCNIQQIKIPSEITSIGVQAFSECENMSSIELSSQITSIAVGTFQGNRNLTEIIIPEGVTGIDFMAFSGCENLTRIAIPFSAKSIGWLAFSGCSKLNEIYYAGNEEEWKKIDLNDMDGGNEKIINADYHYNTYPYDSQKKTYAAGVLESIDKNQNTITISGQTYSASKGFSFDKLADIISSSDKHVAYIIKEGKISSLDKAMDVLQPEVRILSQEDSIIYQDGKYMVDSQPMKVVVSCGTNLYPACTFDDVPDIALQVSSLDLSTSDPNFILTKQGWKQGEETIAVNPGKAYTYESTSHVQEGYIPAAAATVPYSIKAAVCTGRGNISCEQKMIVANLDAQRQLAEQKKESRDQKSGMQDARQELQNLCNSDYLHIAEKLSAYLQEEQIESMERYLYTWLAEISQVYNWIYKWEDVSELQKEVLQRLGLSSDFYTAGNASAVTHIKTETLYGEKTIAVTMHCKIPENGGEIEFNNMDYEILEKEGISDGSLSKGSFGKIDRSFMENFIADVSKVSDNWLTNHLFTSYIGEVTPANFMADKFIMDIVGTEYGAFRNGVYTLFKQKMKNTIKRIKIKCPSDTLIFVRDMDNTCGAIENDAVDDKYTGIAAYADKETKMLYLTGDYYSIRLIGNGPGNMAYTVEELDGTMQKLRTVQFTKVPIHSLGTYNGKILDQIYMDNAFYALEQSDGSIVYPDIDSYQALFKKIERISLNQTDTELALNETMQLTADVYPSDATNKNLRWSSDNEEVVTVNSSGLVRAVGTGKAKITATSKDGSGVSASLEVTVKENPKEDHTPADIESLINAQNLLKSLKSGDALLLEPAFQPYLSTEQIDILESYLYTWLAEVNYAYKYAGNNSTKERIMKKAGIDPDGNFSSGKEQAITHITVDTKYGKKTFEITLDLGKPDSNGNLYPAYGAMHYELLQKEDVPSDIPKTGQIGKSDYTDLGTFVQCVSKAAEDSLHATYQWQSLSDEMTSGVLVDKTVTEIIGNKNGSFSDGTFTIYEKPFFTYSKKVTIACPVDVHVFTMDGKDAGSIVDNEITKKNENVKLNVEGDTKTVYLSGNDYYLNLRGTDTGKMSYKVEELAKLEEAANEEVRRTVQFLELQLKKDLQYEGYVFRPLNIDSDLYALRMIDGSNKETILPKEDTYKSIFKKVQELSLSYGGAATIEQNKSVQLNAKLDPQDASNKSLKWTTDNQSVLSVDGNGLVTAVGAGSATVTVSTKDGSFLKQYCVINVKGGSGNSGGTGGSSSSGSTGGSGSSGGTGNSGSSGNTGGSGNGANGSGGSGNNSDNSGNSPDDTKPSLEPETPPVVVALHYVLQFQTNGGINLSRKTMTLLADDNPGIMPKIQRKGYVFDGWYTQQNGGEQVTGDKPLKAAATLYAHWTKAEAPKKLSAPTIKSKKKGQMKVAFKKVKGAAGYQLQYSTKKGFTSKKTKQLGASAKAKTISGLKAGKEYYVRIRAYSTDSMGNKLYGKYSKAKSVKIYPRAK